jgi:DNA-binding response OmpR family regulator
LVVLEGTTSFLRRTGVKSMKPRACLLLVEDDIALRETLSEALYDFGFDVIAAGNGIEAFAELDADAAQFEEVITDIDLGIGPDGWERGRRARECLSDMPVVYMSGSSVDWPSQGVTNSVCIAKPFALAQMVNAHDIALAAGGKSIYPPKTSRTPTYKVLKLPTGSGYAWGIVTTSDDGTETLRKIFHETEGEAKEDADRSTAKATKVDVTT